MMHAGLEPAYRGMAEGDAEMGSSEALTRRQGMAGQEIGR